MKRSLLVSKNNSFNEFRGQTVAVRTMSLLSFARCLIETNFACLSFDYIHMGSKSTCHLSKYIAANVYGLAISDASVRVNHYEKIGTDSPKNLRFSS